MAGLPKFTEEQQELVVRKLIEMDSYRAIAKCLQNFEDFKPPDMDQEEYEQAVIKRCQEYVSNKSRKWFAIIQDGRQKFKEDLLRWSIKSLMRMSLIGDRYGHRDALNSMELKDAIEIADTVWDLMDRIYTAIYGERDAEFEADYFDPEWLDEGMRRARMHIKEPSPTRLGFGVIDLEMIRRRLRKVSQPQSTIDKTDIPKSAPTIEV